MFILCFAYGFDDGWWKDGNLKDTFKLNYNVT